MRLFLLITSLCFCTLIANCKENYVIGFYNTENLFDTLKSENYNDHDFTPNAKFKWDTHKYNTKIKNTCWAIDQINADIIALSEVENENVIRDLVLNLETVYNYIVLENGDSRGINMALLYKGDKFIPSKTQRINSGSKRNFMLVEGKLGGVKINLMVVHLSSNFNSNKYRERNFHALNQHAKTLCDESTIILGDFNSTPTDKIFRKYMPDNYSNPFREFAMQSKGSYAFNHRWLMYDNMLISKEFTGRGELNFIKAGILINHELLDKSSGYPLRTFIRGTYLGGYSDHLPIWMIVER